MKDAEIRMRRQIIRFRRALLRIIALEKKADDHESIKIASKALRVRKK